MSTTTQCREGRDGVAQSWLVNALGLYVLVMYGATYYAISTAAPRIASDLGVSASLIFAAFSLALLFSAALAPRWGRWVDQAGAARSLLLGAVVRAAAVAAMALAPEIWSFFLALVVVQVLGQLTEYDATFAAAVETSGTSARAAMSQITLWGGVASTAFWPITAVLLDQTGWRTMFVMYAGVMLAVCVPIAALWARRPRPASEAGRPRGSGKPGGASSSANPQPALDAQFVLLAAAFAFAGIAYNLPVLMLPVLDGLGFGAAAVLVGMVFGPSQTAGRLFELLFGHRLHPLGVAIVAVAGTALSLLLLLLDATLWSGVMFAVTFGAGVGVGYVVRGSVVLALYGQADYASWLGRLATIRLLVSAFSPLMLLVILEQRGPHSVVAFCALTAALSFVCFLALERRRRGGALGYSAGA